MTKRTVAFYNPNEKALATRKLKQLQKQNPKEKYILETHKKWKTLDVKRVTKTKPAKKKPSFGFPRPSFKF